MIPDNIDHVEDASSGAPPSAAVRDVPVMDAQASNNMTLVALAKGVLPLAVAASLAASLANGKPWGAMQCDKASRTRVISSDPLLNSSVWERLVGRTAATVSISSACPKAAFGTSIASYEALETYIRILQRDTEASSQEPQVLIACITLPEKPTVDSWMFVTELVNVTRSLPMPAFVCVSGHSDTSQVQRILYPDDTVNINLSTPDHDASLAIKFEAEPLGDIWLDDPDPYLISLLKAKGDTRWRHEKFLTDDVEARYLMRLRDSGKSYEEIGIILQVDKSTVKRRLDKLPAAQRA